MRGARERAAMFGQSLVMNGPDKRRHATTVTSCQQSQTRRLRPLSLLGITLPMLCTTFVLAQLPRQKYLQKNGNLKAMLILRDVQVGTTGYQSTLWTVRPS